MLGLIHKCQLGIAPICLSRFSPKARSTLYHFNKNVALVHDHQIQCHVTPCCLAIVRRSVFALVRVYNRIPPDVVAAKNVSLFQRKLQAMLKSSVSSDVLNWHELFNIE